MSTIRHFENISDFCDFIGEEPLHPLITVTDFSRSHPIPLCFKSYGFYFVMLKQVECGDVIYGRHTYDYQMGTIVFVAPRQVIGRGEDDTMKQLAGKALLFHPRLLLHTDLGKRMRDYHFISYAVHESLHVSEEERGFLQTGWTPSPAA